MANTYYDSQLTAEEIETVLEAVNGLIVPANNGKVLAIEDGVLVAKSVTEYLDVDLQSKTVTPSASQQNIQPDSGYDGLSAVTVEGVIAPNLIAANIKKDVVVKVGTSTDDDSVMAVTGSYEGSGSATLITKSITQNGTYNASSDNADGYSSVIANVPNTYAQSDEGKVVSSGALVAQTARASQITQNGTYDTTNNNSVTVNVSGGTSPLVVPPLQYVKYSHYYNGSGKEFYYSEAIETCVSYELEINSHYILSLNGNPGPRFRRTLLDTEPFTIVPSPIPEPGSLEQVQVQTGVAVNSPSDYTNPATENPAAYSLIPFTATKRYLAVHLSLNAGEDVTCYLFKII